MFTQLQLNLKRAVLCNLHRHVSAKTRTHIHTRAETNVARRSDNICGNCGSMESFKLIRSLEWGTTKDMSCKKILVMVERTSINDIETLLLLEYLLAQVARNSCTKIIE